MKPAPRWALPSVRPHEDHVFDRRQVQAPRGVEPSRTNRPSPRAPKRAEAPRAEDREKKRRSTSLRRCAAPRAPEAGPEGAIEERRARAGGPGPGGTPGPVPNPEVKPVGAESTAAAGPREGRAPPARARRLARRQSRDAQEGPREGPLSRLGGLGTSWVFWAALMLLPVSGTLRIELCPPCCCPLGR